MFLVEPRTVLVGSPSERPLLRLDSILLTWPAERSTIGKPGSGCPMADWWKDSLVTKAISAGSIPGEWHKGVNEAVVIHPEGWTVPATC